jgi:hypothetical protein
MGAIARFYKGRPVTSVQFRLDCASGERESASDYQADVPAFEQPKDLFNLFDAHVQVQSSQAVPWSLCVGLAVRNDGAVPGSRRKHSAVVGRGRRGELDFAARTSGIPSVGAFVHFERHCSA